MRTVIAAVAVAATLLTAAGVLLTESWMILAGAVGVIVAIVMAALVGPALRRRRG